MRLLFLLKSKRKYYAGIMAGKCKVLLLATPLSFVIFVLKKAEKSSEELYEREFTLLSGKLAS